jgi:hypothetical protein
VSDKHSAKSPCPSKPPCATVIWLRGSEHVKHNGDALLTSKSEGKWMPSGAKPIIFAGQTVLFNG